VTKPACGKLKRRLSKAEHARIGFWNVIWQLDEVPRHCLAAAGGRPQTRPHKLLAHGEKMARKELDKTHFLSILSASIFISL
jgi:hypothetical protein